MVEITEQEKILLKRYLQFMAGFEESTLYEDYKSVEELTDQEYADAIELIRRIAEGEFITELTMGKAEDQTAEATEDDYRMAVKGDPK